MEVGVPVMMVTDRQSGKYGNLQRPTADFSKEEASLDEGGVQRIKCGWIWGH